MPLPATLALETFLNTTTQGVMIPLITITLRDGTVLRWARHQQNVAFDATTWLAHGRGGRPLVMAYRWRAPVGLDEIGTCELELGCGDSAVLGTERLQLAAAKGAFARARLLVEEAYAATPSSAIVGKLAVWGGRIEAAPGDSHSVRLQARSVVADLKATQLPKTLVTATCGNALYDIACGVSRAAHTASRTVAAGSTKNVVKISGADADKEWDGGTLTVVTGTLAGEKRGIREFTAGAAVLAHPLPAALAVDVAVTVTRGCDRTTGPGGCVKFDNLVRFRAMPHLPKEG